MCDIVPDVCLEDNKIQISVSVSVSVIEGLSGPASVKCLSVRVIHCFLFYFEVLSVSYSTCPVKRCPSGVSD